ncbi:2-dehydropantoate 2-reductase [Tepidibacillus marianensis]|uniref:ketopantoate reductase family protein n=1 Tax=Tepidibacillus marianensis TaxID=3131995 RepID=UPI0030D1B827
MKIAIIGAGSLGLLYASRLKKYTNAELFLITRTEEQKMKLIKENLQMYEQDGTNYTIYIQTFSQFEHGQAMDWIFLMVKQTDRMGIEKTIEQWSGEKTKILCFQNGIGHREYLQQQIPNPLYSAITTEGALRLDENRVKHTGKGETWMGYPEQSYDDSMEELLYLFNQAGFLSFYSEKIMEKSWRKLAINAVINPLTALFEVKNGVLNDDLYLQRLVKRLVTEITEVIALANIDIGQEIEQAIRQVCISTKENESSMLQDIKRGRKTEIDSITVPFLNLGKNYLISTPLLEGITWMVHAKENLMDKRKG